MILKGFLSEIISYKVRSPDITFADDVQFNNKCKILYDSIKFSKEYFSGHLCNPPH